MTITVYKITNTVTNKTYIGQTTNYQKRKTQHFSQLRCNRHPNEHLQRSFNKYGEDNFTMDIIKKCHINELDNWERWYISVNQSNNPKYGYNLESGGNLNKTHSEETKQKMSKAHKGRVFTKEHCENISKAQKGRFRSEEYIKKITSYLPHFSGENHPMYGKHHTDETKKKISETKKGQTLSDETKDLLSELHSKYTLWDWKKVKYDKSIMFQRNREPNPCKCFKLIYNKKRIEIGRFEEFLSPMIINDFIENEVKV